MADPGAYLFVVRGESSAHVSLPDEGRLIVGSGDRADVRVGGVAAEAAELVLTRDEAHLTARPGTELEINGERAGATRSLTSGDVVVVGDATLVMHRAPGLPRARRALTLAALRTRLHQETERALRGVRPLAILAIELGATSGGASRAEIERAVFGAIRFEDLFGWEPGGSELVVVLPETGEEARVPARRVLEALAPLAPGARGGLALCPADALSADALITGGRVAVQRARPGEVARLSGEASSRPVADRRLVAIDPMTRSLQELVEHLARSDIPVLISGETGVGKELIALALHHWSPRSREPIVTINCAAVAETLFESELFGHERGAFTGAASAKQGLLAAAGRGTVVLDEIGECPLASQAKLLRVLETRQANRIGALEPHPIGARFVAVTNRRLDDEVAAGRFRRDLFYRLSAASLVVPPLRDRTLEIPALARAFLAEARARLGRPALELEAAAVQRLCLHDWPGNVRELKNVMEFCAATVDGPALGPDRLPPAVGGAAPPWLVPGRASPAPPAVFRSLRDEVRELERTRMQQALTRTGGARAQAASLIGMPLRTFVTKLRVYGLGGAEPRGERARGG